MSTDHALSPAMAHELIVRDLCDLFVALEDEDLMEVEFRAYVIQQRAFRAKQLGIAQCAACIVACCRLEAPPQRLRTMVGRLAKDLNVHLMPGPLR